jgi:hypothetical protein
MKYELPATTKDAFLTKYAFLHSKDKTFGDNASEDEHRVYFIM